MMSGWTLLIAALPLLVMSSEVQQCSFQSTPHMLDSLQCNNDYMTHIRCTWEEEQHTFLHLAIKNEEGSTCIPDGPAVQLPNGKLYRSCIYKTNIFTWKKRTVFFNASCPSKTTTLKISQHGKYLSPVNLSEREVDGGRRLNWSSPYSPSSPLTHTLTYQVKYRRHGHDWIVLGDTNATDQLIEKTDLQPGYSYEAKVRARGQTEQWSDWSQPVIWITKEEGVLNLQCVVEEKGVLCSWQVKEEHAIAFSYHLCWQTNGSNQICQNCPNRTKLQTRAMVDFTCSVSSPEPEQLTIEVKTVHNSKNFVDALNIRPPRVNHVQVMKENGEWKLNWSRPDVPQILHLIYEVRLYPNTTKDYRQYNKSNSDVLLHILPSSLLPSATYGVQVRVMTSGAYSGQPSHWSEPVFFKNDAVSRTATIIYILISVFVTMFFIILYNALPFCHRKLELWKVSIPSPIKSKVLEEMRSKSSHLSWVNPYSENEKASVCIIQPLDTTIIYKDSISECPLLPCSEDSFTTLEWPHQSDHTFSYTEGSGMSVKSAMSFTGPYILCTQKHGMLDRSFYTISAFDEDNASIKENAKDSPPIHGGYVSTPPTSFSSTEHSSPLDNSAQEITKSSQSQPPHDDDPPAYTPNPTVMQDALFSHPSGYCLMPNMENNTEAWEEVSAPSPGDGIVSQTNSAGEGDQRVRGYVTLSEPLSCYATNMRVGVAVV